MTGQILVPLRRRDRMEDILPFLEQIARPGCKVTLLIHYSVQGLDWFQNKSMSSVIEKQHFACLGTAPRERRDRGFRYLRRPAEESRKAIYA